jgi:hypothetical protein
MKAWSLLMFIVLAARVMGASSEGAEMERLRQMRVEIAARRLVREHESGAKKASDEQLAVAREIIHQSEERRAREAAPGPDGGFAIAMKDVDVATVAKMWQEVFGGVVVAAERARSKRVSISESDRSLDTFRGKLEAALRKSGVYLVYRPDRLILDSAPDPHPPK